MSSSETGARKALIIAAVLLPALIVIGQAAYFYHVNMSELDLGMPIDDAYIYKRYAENIAHGNGYSFNPGETSFGATGVIYPPVMALLTAALPFLEYVSVAFWLGALCLAGAASSAVLITRRKTGSAGAGLLAGVLIAASPLLFMNAISGMEAPLTIALLTLFAWLALSEKERPAAAGLTAGLLTLCRPEAAYFPMGAIFFFALSYLSRGQRVPIKSAAKFIAGWALLAVPVALVVHHQIGSFLPNTYMGKIISSVPGSLDRGIIERAVLGVMSFIDGWVALAWPLHFLAPVMAVGLLWVGLSALRDFLGRDRGQKPYLLLVLLGYFTLPGSYGFSYPIHPPFGGYYVRYIAPLFAVWMILGAIGLHGVYAWAAGRWSTNKEKARIIAGASLAIMLLYQGYLWSFQHRDALEVFKREVTLNTGLRMDAAKWIRQNTPSNAKIMVGYTGLGVVGGEAGRYVLDVGALINPDIYDYYIKSGTGPKQKWQAILEYMKDRKIDYYVTFTAPEDSVFKIPDPAETDGISEVARLGVKGEPEMPYQQIRIYRVEHDEI